MAAFLQKQPADRRRLLADLKKAEKRKDNCGLIIEFGNCGRDYDKLLDRLGRKLRDRLDIRHDEGFEYTKIVLICEPDSKAVVTHNGNVYNEHISGLLCLAGNFYVRGQSIELSPRFVSRPFWQLSKRAEKYDHAEAA